MKFPRIAGKNLNPVLGGRGLDSWWGTRSLVLDELGLEAGSTFLQLFYLGVDLRNFVLDRRVVQDSAGDEDAVAEAAHGRLEGHGKSFVRGLIISHVFHAN